MGTYRHTFRSLNASEPHTTLPQKSIEEVLDYIFQYLIKDASAESSNTTDGSFILRVPSESRIHFFTKGKE